MADPRMTPDNPMADHEPLDARLELREKLAAIEHQRWAHWQQWMHDQGVRRNGWLRLPTEMVERWERQIATPYADLSPAEQASDMEQVDRYWGLIEPILRENERLREGQPNG